MYELLTIPRKSPYVEPRASGVYTLADIQDIVCTFNRMRLPSGSFPTFRYSYRRQRIPLIVVEKK